MWVKSGDWRVNWVNWLVNDLINQSWFSTCVVGLLKWNSFSSLFEFEFWFSNDEIEMHINLKFDEINWNQNLGIWRMNELIEWFKMQLSNH